MQISAPWDGSTTGDAEKLAPLNSQEWTDFWQVFFSSGDIGDEDRGVFRGYLNELEVTGATSPVRVDSGGAVVMGRWYRNDAPVAVYVSIPATSTRTDRVILRCSWAAQTIRVEMLTNPTEGTGTPPALTQSHGVTWEIPLATVTVTTGVVISLVDERLQIHVAERRVVRHFIDVLGCNDGDPPMSSLGVPLEDGDHVWAYGKWAVPGDFVKNMEVYAIIVTDAAITGSGYANLALTTMSDRVGYGLLHTTPPGTMTNRTRVHFTVNDLGVFKWPLMVRPTGQVAGMSMRLRLERADDGSGWDNLPGTIWCVGFLAKYVSGST